MTRTVSYLNGAARAAIVATALVASGCAGAPADNKAAPPASAASTSAVDEQAIRALEATFAAAVKKGDVDGIMSVYVPDETLHVFDVSPPREYVGAVAYRKDWQDTLGLFPKGLTDFAMSNLVVTLGDGSLAATRSIQHIAGADKTGQPMELTVRVSDVLRKTNGSWHIIEEHVSVPVDLETGKPDMTSKP